MKYLVLIFSLVALPAISQTNLVRGSKYVSGKYGVSKYSPVFTQLDYGWMYNETMTLRFSGYFESGKVGSTILNHTGIGANQLFTVFSKGLFSGSLGLGVYGGHEWVRSDRNPIKNNAWVYGARGLAELDFALGEKTSLKAEFSQFYIQRSKIGNWFYTGTIGFTYIIN